jgi:hypothetical protein
MVLLSIGVEDGSPYLLDRRYHRITRLKVTMTSLVFRSGPAASCQLLLAFGLSLFKLLIIRFSQRCWISDWKERMS